MAQAAISTVYALLNEITRYSTNENGAADGHYKPALNGGAISGAPALEQLNEKQKQQVCVNVLSAIVGVAVYLKDDEVIDIIYIALIGLLK